MVGLGLRGAVGAAKWDVVAAVVGGIGSGKDHKVLDVGRAAWTLLELKHRVGGELKKLGMWEGNRNRMYS